MGEYLEEEEEEYEREATNKGAMIKGIMLFVVCICSFFIPTYMYQFDLLAKSQVWETTGFLGLTTVLASYVYYHRQTSSIGGKMFFAPFMYFKRPGVVYEEYQALIKNIIPLREVELTTILEDKLMTSTSLAKDGLNIPGYILDAKLDGKTFIAMGEHLGVEAKIVEEWWLTLGGDLTPEEVKSIHDFPHRNLVEFEDLSQLDATIVCSKVPFAELGKDQEREELLYNDFWVTGRGIPIALHEIVAFNYEGIRMSVSVPSACDYHQSKILEGAGSFNMPNSALGESAKRDYDQGYIGPALRRQLFDANQHLRSILSSDKPFNERVLGEVSRRRKYEDDLDTEGSRFKGMPLDNPIVVFGLIVGAMLLGYFALSYFGVI